jgi:hypothetical protein
MKTQLTVISLATLLCACSTEPPIDGLPDGPSGAVPAAAADTRGPVAQPLPEPIPGLVPERVTSVDELPGDWYQPFALPGRLSYLSLSPPQLGLGEYSGFRSCGVVFCLPITGAYRAVPENPAVGFAFLQLDPVGTVPGGGPTYVLDNLWRTEDGTLVALQARRLYPTGFYGAPFYLYRVIDEPAQPTALADADEAALLDVANGLDATAMIDDGELDDDLAAGLVAARGAGFASSDEITAAADRMYAADPALCTYYQGLAEYYAIRALQCAYSVCYPMSPWYGFWAQYYQNLADQVCPNEA